MLGYLGGPLRIDCQNVLLSFKKDCMSVAVRVNSVGLPTKTFGDNNFWSFCWSQGMLYQYFFTKMNINHEESLPCNFFPGIVVNQEVKCEQPNI